MSTSELPFPPAGLTVGEVFRNIVKHPMETVVLRWNWKSALLSAMMRSMIYFTTYLVKKDGIKAAVGAMIVEFCLRIFTAGTSGTIVQNLRKARPLWFSGLTASLLLPAFSHTVEYTTHFVHEYVVSQIYNSPINQTRKTSFGFSIMFSVLSVIFNLYAVRRGVLVVGKGEGGHSLAKDLKQMPSVILGFITFPVRRILRYFREQS